MVRTKLALLLLAVAASFSTLHGQNIINGTYGDGITVETRDTSFKLTFGARMQHLFIAENDLTDPADKTSTQLMVRRARLKFDGHVFSPKLKYKMELGLSNRDQGNVVPEGGNAPNHILDAVAKWNFAKGFELWVGQTKLPGNRERVVSSSSLQFVDRSLVNSEFNIDRDMGVQLHHQHKLGKVIIREKVALSKGEGRNITAATKGGFDYTGRIEILPFGKFEDKGDYFESDLAREEKPKVMIGAGYDYNQDAQREQGQLGKFLTEQRDLSMIFADIVFKYRGISVSAEYMNKETDLPVLYDPAGNVSGAFFTGIGYTAQAGYLFKNNFELAGRYTAIDPASPMIADDVVQYTLGVSKYIQGHDLKVQTDISLLEDATASTQELMYRLQVEVGF